MKNCYIMQKKSIDVPKDVYLWVHKRVGDYRIQIDCKGKYGYEGMHMNENQIYAMLRRDCLEQNLFQKEAKLKEKICAVIYHLSQLAKKELNKLENGH